MIAKGIIIFFLRASNYFGLKSPWKISWIPCSLLWYHTKKHLFPLFWPILAFFLAFPTFPFLMVFLPLSIVFFPLFSSGVICQVQANPSSNPFFPPSQVLPYSQGTPSTLFFLFWSYDLSSIRWMTDPYPRNCSTLHLSVPYCHLHRLDWWAIWLFDPLYSLISAPSSLLFFYITISIRLVPPCF